MAVVIKVIVIGTLILALIVVIPQLFGNIAPLVTDAFSGEISGMVTAVFNIIPPPLVALILALVSALIIAVIIRFTINEK